jgi:hypothetical protein
MAESASWIASCCPAFGWSYEMWHSPYEAAQAAASETAVTSSVVATVLVRWWQAGLFTSWEGTATELSEALRQFLDEREKRLWPVGPTQFGSKLRRAAPDLRALGIDIRFGPLRRKERGIFIKRADAADAASERGPAVIPTAPPAPQDNHRWELQLGYGNNGRTGLLPTLPTLLSSVEEKEEGRRVKVG